MFNFGYQIHLCETFFLVKGLSIFNGKLLSYTSEVWSLFPFYYVFDICFKTDKILQYFFNEFLSFLHFTTYLVVWSNSWHELNLHTNKTIGIRTNIRTNILDDLFDYFLLVLFHYEYETLNCCSSLVLTHFWPMFHLQINQVIDFY